MEFVYFFMFTLVLCITNACFGEAGILRSIQIAKSYNGIKCIKIFFLSYAHAMLTDCDELPNYEKVSDKEVNAERNGKLQLAIDMWIFNHPTKSDMASDIRRYNRNPLTHVYPPDTLIGTEKMRQSR